MFRTFEKSNDIMAEFEDPYKKFQNSMQHIHAKLHVLDTPIPIEVQSQYFQLSQKVRDGLNKDIVLNQKESLFDPEYEHEFKKRLLLSLAALDDVDAYRTIERYNEAPDDYLSDFAKIALEECKMNLERSLSDEEQIFVSTGLGGREDKLRFFIVFFSKEEHAFTDFQVERTRKEVEFAFGNNNCELEEFTPFKDYITIKALFPYKMDIKDMLNGILNEVNQYGDFIQYNLLITNIKEFNKDEISRFKTDSKKSRP